MMVRTHNPNHNVLYKGVTSGVHSSKSPEAISGTKNYNIVYKMFIHRDSAFVMNEKINRKGLVFA